MSERLKALADAGVSIWLDDLSRDRLTSNNLADLVANSSVTGVTTNPTIFAGALSKGDAYNAQTAELAARDSTVEDTIKALTTDDVRNACDVLAATSAATNGVDGRVSIEVEPGLARNTEATIAQAQDLWKIVDRPNALIKIPATLEGLPAIAAVTGEGISVNVTLIFSLERYAGVIDAYLTGLEQAAANGHDLSKIHSVASFFVSRVDTEVDKRLAAIGTDEALALKSKAAIANARLAYELFEQTFAGERWAALEAQGANKQRPLWASTGVKDPALPDTLYVSELVVADTVNTMPEKTMQAFADHGEVTGDEVSGKGDEARAVLAAIEALGISFDDVVQVLEDEGVDKFDKSWAELVATVEGALDEAKAKLAGN
ncbi:transaldolase [Microlunatus phosphovorus NM-1]|uniref:Transaldolase n=1 Tax=Microlunatus phosphovorus (strain ATCC 700054 / DSM 10555 / JCM 9379 / NBRC 101784 / NCIMB 13414 / VKM Ac-1990 / NM-1) TaxID=1032480 RepID=F5XQE0_MICPN|nr:transaldolase [Microlunatus phosphovorus]BAK34440.1 transaldolase [Microlunatus phosphovorus NM-1]